MNCRAREGNSPPQPMRGGPSLDGRRGGVGPILQIADHRFGCLEPCSASWISDMQSPIADLEHPFALSLSIVPATNVIDRTDCKKMTEFDQHHPVCAYFGGFAISSSSRIHPSSAEEGTSRSPANSFTPSMTAPASENKLWRFLLLPRFSFLHAEIPSNPF